MLDPVIQSVPLDQLEISTANVRKIGAGRTALDELKASITALGIIENLVVRPLSPDTQGKPRYAVSAGGRRLSALTELADEGVIEANYPVPCRVVRNGADDTEISLAENVVRCAMHPADQVEAFAALARAGASVADIAARFGVSERTVERRLRLGHLAPELLDAYREDKLDLAMLKAFSVTTDRTRQLTVWEQLSQQPYRPNDWQIRRMLTEDRVPAGAALARYVGVDAYETEGGTVLRDLFADQCEEGVWLEDPALLMKLGLDRLQATADELATTWKWAEARLDIDWSDLARFGRVHPTPADPTDGEKAEIEQLNVRHDELVNLDDDEWTEELLEEGETIEQRMQTIEAGIKARAVYQPDDIAISGCIATVGDDGQLFLIRGLVKPEDMPGKDAGDNDTTATGTATNTGQQQPGSGVATPTMSAPAMPPSRQDREAKARKQAGMGIGLADDLRAIRTTLVKAHLADNFAAAFDLALFQMARAVFTPGYDDHALDITVRETPERPPLRANDDTFHESSPGEAMLADRSSLPFDWLEIEDRGESFAALRALPINHKQRLFAACVARTLNGQLAFEPNARPETEATVARLDIDFATHVRPGAEIYWSRVRKDRMIAVARETLGIEWVHTHRKDKKTALATAMETAFAAGDAVPLGVPKDGRAAALAWVPPGFAPFDSGRIDDGDDSPSTKAEHATANEAAKDPAPDTPAPDPTPESAPADTEAADAATDAQPEPTGSVPAGPSTPPAAPEADTSTPAETPEHDSGADSKASPQPADQLPADLRDTVEAMNGVPTADGGPRVIISTVGFDNGAQDDADPDTETAVAQVPANAADTAAAGEATEVPAFLRRS